MTIPLSAPNPRDRKNLNALEWCCFFGASTLYARVLGLLDNISMIVALPSIYFIVYLLFNSHRARSARRSEEHDDIYNARALADQCIYAMECLMDGMEMWSEHRVHIALNTLSARIDLFTARYRRYLDYQAKVAAMESADAIACAQFEDLDPAEQVARAKALMERIRGRILDVDHPSLRAARS